jgi:hypothetical protein
MRVITILPLKNPEWIYNILNGLPEETTKYCVSVHKENKNVDFINFIYLYKEYKWDLTDKEIQEEEQFLGTCFNTILTAYKKEYKKENYIYLANLVCFWRKTFEENEIDLFIGRLEAYPNDYVSALVARKMNVKYISFGLKFLNNLCLLDINGYPILWKQPSEKEIKEGVKFFEDSIINFRSYITKHNKAKSNNKFIIINDIIEKLTLSKERKMEASSLSKAFVKQIKGIINKKITKLIVSNEWNKKNIYYALHWEYETYLYREHGFVNQYELLYSTAKCCPLTHDLLYRNHPAYGGFDINIGMIKKIEQLPNTKYIPFSVKSNDILKETDCVIGMFSTALLEGIIMRKPTICLYNKQYHVEDVSLFVDNIEDLPKTINYALTKFKINEEKRKYYLGQLYIHLIPLEGKITSLGPTPSVQEGKKIGKEIVNYLKEKQMFK